VDGPHRDPPGADHPGEPRALWAGEREVELRRDAALEHVEMFGQGQHRLHHVQVMDPAGVHGCQGRGEEVSLLLVVAFQADAVAGLQHRL